MRKKAKMMTLFAKNPSCREKVASGHLISVDFRLEK